jgi:hypothetical protein
MQGPAYAAAFARAGLAVRVPSAEDQDAVDRIIFEELCLGRVSDASRDALVRGPVITARRELCASLWDGAMTNCAPGSCVHVCVQCVVHRVGIAGRLHCVECVCDAAVCACCGRGSRGLCTLEDGHLY